MPIYPMKGIVQGQLMTDVIEEKPKDGKMEKVRTLEVYTKGYRDRGQIERVRVPLNYKVPKLGEMGEFQGDVIFWSSDNSTIVNYMLMVR